LNKKTQLTSGRALLVIKIKVPVVATGTDARNEVMADLASDAVELYGGILFTTLMAMLVSFGHCGSGDSNSSDSPRYPTASSGPSN
jgi:hypothetical protein